MLVVGWAAAWRPAARSAATHTATTLEIRRTDNRSLASRRGHTARGRVIIPANRHQRYTSTRDAASTADRSLADHRQPLAVAALHSSRRRVHPRDRHAAPRRAVCDRIRRHGRLSIGNRPGAGAPDARDQWRTPRAFRCSHCLGACARVDPDVHLLDRRSRSSRNDLRPIRPRRRRLRRRLCAFAGESCVRGCHGECHARRYAWASAAAGADRATFRRRGGGRRGCVRRRFARRRVASRLGERRADRRRRRDHRGRREWLRDQAVGDGRRQVARADRVLPRGWSGAGRRRGHRDRPAPARLARPPRRDTRRAPESRAEHRQ
jgi:hypothetical protein